MNPHTRKRLEPCGTIDQHEESKKSKLSSSAVILQSSSIPEFFESWMRRLSQNDPDHHSSSVASLISILTS